MDTDSSFRGGSGEPLVLIHGFSDTWRAWRPLLPRLEPHHDTLAVTLAGHFGGVKLEGEPGTGGLIDAVARDMDAAGFETAHLVGNSLGGWIALELAARGRARSVVGLSPAGGWQRGGRSERRIVRLFKRNHRAIELLGERAGALVARPRLRALALRDIVARPKQVPPAAALDMIEGAAHCEIYLESLDEMRRGNFPATLGPIDCRVRIAWGTKDRVLPLRSASAELRRLVPNAQWVELAGLGHCPMWDDPELVTRTILEVTTARSGEVEGHSEGDIDSDELHALEPR